MGDVCGAERAGELNQFKLLLATAGSRFCFILEAVFRLLCAHSGRTSAAARYPQADVGDLAWLPCVANQRGRIPSARARQAVDGYDPKVNFALNTAHQLLLRRLPPTDPMRKGDCSDRPRAW